MIVLNVTYRCKPGMREKLLETIKTEGIDAASRAEAGNIKYDYYLSAQDDNEILLLEKWRDAGAVSSHQEEAHFKRLGEIKGEFVEETILEKYINE
ncbi:MAG: antibiotic biosynthesis monooxygenase [Clostridiales bacterium]|nr:antibiotic biosynthesis monooxygenase [Clostridiales bacterium]